MLNINDDGTLNIGSVDDLSPDELSAWVEARLHGTDVEAPGGAREGVGQYYLVGAIYPDLRLSTKRDIRDILLRLLRQMAAGHADWRGRAGDDMLLLAMQIGAPDLIAPVKLMAEQEIALEPPNPERHARIVQTLVSLGEKMTERFWKDLVERDADLYLTLSFAGLRLHSVYQALGLLCDIDLDEDTQAKLYPSLRGLLRRRDTTRDDLRVALRDMRSVLPSPVLTFVKRALPELRQTPTPASLAKPLAKLESFGFSKEPVERRFKEAA